MPSLADRLRERIRAEGPIGVDEYMEACNRHYYGTRDPLGAAGDFTTAPEVSQMFGELVGAALADCWMRAGAPAEALYAELGPGRGTLAADALRVLRHAGFAGRAHFVETSPRLRAEQAERVPDAAWHEAIGELPAAPLLTIANEFFDALPVRQWIGGEQRRVALAGERLVFAGDGEIGEDSPARAGAAAALARHLAEHGGVALVIDYGHARTAPGDTLQAVKAHRFADPLADPGEQDLTAHVDFEALGQAARGAGAAIAGPAEQGAWLRALGIEARAAALAKAQPQRASQLAADLARLNDDGQMGRLFKVMAIHSADWPVPAGFER